MQAPRGCATVGIHLSAQNSKPVYTWPLGNHAACAQEVKKNNKHGSDCKAGTRGLSFDNQALFMRINVAFDKLSNHHGGQL